MYTTNRHLLIFLTLIGLILMAAPTLARQSGPPMSPEDRQERMEARQERMKILLDLSEVQQDLLQQHREKHRGEMQAMQEARRDIREQIRIELENPAMEVSRLDQLREELKELSGKIADHRIDGILEVREILTAEQFTKFLALSPGPGHGKGRDRGLNSGLGINCPQGSPPPMD